MITVSRNELMEYATLCRQQGAQAITLQEWLLRAGKGEGMPLLKGLDLRGADLSFTKMAGARIDGCTLENANLEQADFSGAEMPRTCLIGAWVCGTDFSGADMRGSRFDGAKLLAPGPLAPRGMRNVTDFTAARLDGCSFTNTQCRNLVFTAAQLPQAQFCGAELENTRFNHANMVGADLRGCTLHLRKAVGTRSHPVGVEFNGAVVIGAKGLEACEAALDYAIGTPQQLAGALDRMAAMAQGDPRLPQPVQQQLEARRAAAEELLGYGNAPEVEAGLLALNHACPRSGGFAAQVRQPAGQQRSR